MCDSENLQDDLDGDVPNNRSQPHASDELALCDPEQTSNQSDPESLTIMLAKVYRYLLAHAAEVQFAEHSYQPVTVLTEAHMEHSSPDYSSAHGDPAVDTNDEVDMVAS